ncbi:MAG: protein pucC [Blastomonas sp. CACIA14H2]|uniref:BCD family MFS transporter n=1 Tax=Blastomonas sp. CACIA14H2 TaxID=1419876 RepID=UPI0003D02167|nr:MAG: protein pucC [Blastomonas sp. CACIA14H2]
MSLSGASTRFFAGLGTQFLPFADAASAELPMGRLLRLSLFQVTVGVATVLLNGTLNRVMIVELGTPAWLVALMIAIPLLVAPFRALIGHKSDYHKSMLGWRRVPYIWFGSLLQFGGLAIMPFALLLLSRPDTFTIGMIAGALAFLLTGLGMHTTQTAGLALATDLAPEDTRPRVVALMFVMLLVGMMGAAFVMGSLLADFSATRLVAIVQGAAMFTMALNVIALWKQEARAPLTTRPDRATPKFSVVWREFTSEARNARLLLAIGCGTAAFSMQDVLLEPFGGEVLGMSVGSTTSLTGLWAFGMLVAFALAARRLGAGADPLRLAGFGAAIGMLAFAMILFAAPLEASFLVFSGALTIGLGAGLFSVGTLSAIMGIAGSGRHKGSGLALGAWGAVQASASGLAVAAGGLIRDAVSSLALADRIGETLAYRATGYGTVYLIEIVLLLVTMVVLGPLVGGQPIDDSAPPPRFGLTEFPT